MADGLPFCITVMGNGVQVQKVLCEVRGINGENNLSEVPQVQEIAQRVARSIDYITRFPGFELPPDR